jgi:hypothetical protein
MKTSAYLPVGTQENNKTVLINKGDVVKLCTGELVTFTEMKRVKFVGKLDGRGIQVPVYRNKYDNTPYILEVTGKKDKKVLEARVKPTGLKYGNLFALEGHKETFMFVGTEVKRGKNKLVAIDLATGKQFGIGEGFDFVKVNVPKIKRDNPVKA